MGSGIDKAYPPMADRKADLELIEKIIRRSISTTEPVKHHEVSQALVALERIERALAAAERKGVG